jgi:CopG family transcriptional regulator, nickel-responsive regulator
MSEKERVSLAIEPELLAEFDALVERSGHGNRSEAVRDLIRGRLLEEEFTSSGRAGAVGTVTLVYDHTKRDLADRLLEVGHDHHGEVIATLHVHLDHDHCLEVIALRGKPKELRQIADHLIGMKGVQHGKLVITRATP